MLPSPLLLRQRGCGERISEKGVRLWRDTYSANFFFVVFYTPEGLQRERISEKVVRLWRDTYSVLFQKKKYAIRAAKRENFRTRVRLWRDT